MDETTLTSEGEEVKEHERHNKSVEDETKVEDQIGVSKVKELLPKARTPLKKVRKVAAELMSNVLIRDMPKTSKSTVLVLSQDSYESKGLTRLRRISWALEFHPWVSQEDKQALPKGVVLLDSEPNIPIPEMHVLNYDVQDVRMRCMMSSAHCHHCCRVLLLIVHRQLFNAL
ncbi:hypothetical protein Cgig2_007972 [Carnegiea gigantea]|uniref:Uncharacterized protein n=1 Tax=Carnegiea gigantea TaxID=171969 RepID=A0A9Q1JF89_9CARY|nr:hypothetical protein Cgig2_007972 [Carnegiea gigantea]